MSGSLLSRLSALATLAGVLVLLHAGFSAHHYKRLVSSISVSGDEGSLEGGAAAADVTASGPPLDVYLEVLLSFALILAAQILPLRFEPVRQMARAARARTWAEATSRPEFALFNSQAAKFTQRTERARAVQQQMKR